jgi:MarR family transcriptional regulator for hemolysin
MPFSPARELGFALNDAARLLRTYADQRAKELNTTRAQWAVLVRLQRCEGVKQSELAVALDLAPITLARLIDKLSAAGLVERRDDDSDRRANRLYLTEKATPTLKKLGEYGEALMGKVLAGLDAHEIAALTTGLRRIKTNLKAELNGGAS